MLIRVFYSVIFFLFASSAHAMWTEVSGSFRYSKDRYGADRTSNTLDRTYRGVLAFYFFERTALEFNYSKNTQVDVDNSTVAVDAADPNFKVTKLVSRLDSQVLGIGVRQAFAPSKSTFTPVLSFGYARETRRSSRDYYIDDNGTATRTLVNDPTTKYDSNFASFVLRIRLSKRFTLNGSAYTVFRALKWSEAKYSMKYLAGFSWIF